ncbi:MAG: hypothetical protein ABIS86_03085 [Streptosporangiaceae bacterium]
MTVSAELAEIDEWWARVTGSPGSPIAGSAADQLTPDGTDNPYWELVRRLPAACGGPDGAVRGLPVGHHALATRYSWAIPSPGDIRWLAGILGDLALFEVGAGSGYWAWQARQAGIDVIAYEPSAPGDNGFNDGVEYVRTLRAGVAAAALHPDRALLLCWPSHGDPWAAQALESYTGDLIVYIGEGRGGRCADEGFFDLLGRHWVAIGSSPHHVTWRHADCTMTAYRRSVVPRQDDGG